MNTKNIWVSFIAVMTVMFLVATVSAATDVTNNLVVKVDDVNAKFDNLAVEAGQTIEVKAIFTSDVDASDVTVKAEIEGNKVDTSAITGPFDVETGQKYVKTLTIEVPYELKDDLSEDINLVVTVKKNGNLKTESEYSLRVQRPSYNADILSIVTSSSVEAGESFPVDVVIRNVGYNDLDDVYVSAKLSALNGVERTVYFGDLVALEANSDDDDDTETVSGRINLKIPYDAESGIYVLDVEVSNDDLDLSAKKQIVIKNDFPSPVIKAGNDLLVVNPTDKLKVYRVVAPDSESFVTVGAGSTKAVEVTPTGEDYIVNVLTMNGELVASYKFNTLEAEDSATSPIVVLTVILAIIFLVLLIVLIVLIGKKPEKAEEFGESYY